MAGAGVPPAGVGAPAHEMIPCLEEGQIKWGAGKEYTSLGDQGEYDSKGDKRIPWYKMMKGIIILTVLALIIIGAAVGGGVGGALSGKSSNNKNNTKPIVGITSAQTTPTSSGAPETSESITMATNSQHAPLGETLNPSSTVTQSSWIGRGRS